MSAGGDPSTAGTIKNIPIWAFHGSADDVVPVQTTRDMVAALQAVGGNIQYTEVAGGDHYIWPSVYADADNTLYPWLFSQQLDPGPSLFLPPVSAAVASLALTPGALPEPASLGLVALGGLDFCVVGLAEVRIATCKKSDRRGLSLEPIGRTKLQ